MDIKRMIRVVVLVTIIIAAVIFIQRQIRTMNNPALPTMPERMSQEPISKIDMNTLETSTAPFIDWTNKYGIDVNGRYKSPKTGEYTMVDIITCTQCSKQIPELPIPPDIKRSHGPDRGLAVAKLRKEYVCPHCKKNPFEPPPPVTPETPPPPPVPPK
jgi:hypothetical protein